MGETRARKEFLMKVSSALQRMLWQFPLLFLLWAHAGGQAIQPLESIKSQAELDKTGAALDAALFDSFNRCDLEKFGTFLTENVEFYDDRDGLSVGRQRQVEDLKNYICGKVTREIVPGRCRSIVWKAMERWRWGSPFPPSGARRHGAGGRREIYSSLAIQRWRVENHTDHQL